MKRWTKQQFHLSSASDGPGIVPCDKEAGYPGNFIDVPQLRSRTDDTAVLHEGFSSQCLGKKENQLSFSQYPE